MSGVLKSIGKAFRKVVKVVKRIALPLIAVAAVVLTGGAALGFAPFAGGIAGTLGITGPLAGILSTAGQSALLGAGVSAITGGNIVKGATGGFIAGGVLGGLGAAAGTIGKTATTVGGVAQAGTGAALPAAAGAVPSAAATGLGGFAKAAGSALTQANIPLSSNLVASAPAVSSGGGLLGGIGRFVEKNPIVAGQVISGIGGGLSAAQDRKAAVKDRKHAEANYADTSGLYRLNNDADLLSSVGEAGDRYRDIIYGKVRYDKRSGRLYSDGG